MIDHPVIDVLMSFTNEEIKQFRRFINSPYFIRSETVGSLFELLIKFHPGFKSKRLTKEYISENIYKTEKYNDSTIRNALADLLDTCELFLMQENFRKNSTFSFDFLLKELRDKKLSNVFQKKSSEFDKKYSQIENVDSEYYLAKYKFELNKYNFYSLNEKVTGSNEVEKHFKEIFNSGLYITIHYIIEIISIYLTSVFYSIKFNKPLSENYLYTLIKTLNIENLEKIIKNSEHNFLVNIYISL
ncbi:MAG: hypothetical protein NTU73_06885, partial [Ignavibacteriae bacterium]|nr:hypothetical protein [Ignavibacteriota bacterium]